MNFASKTELLAEKLPATGSLLRKMPVRLFVRRGVLILPIAYQSARAYFSVFADMLE